MPESERLADVTQTITAFIAGLTRQPQALRVRVGEVDLDLQWAPAGGGPAAEPGGTPASAPAATTEEYVRAPSVGVFYRAQSPGAAPFVKVGDAVEANQQVGVIEAMKLMIPVEATRPGRITDLLKDDGEPAEYDEPLFAFLPCDAG